MIAKLECYECGYKWECVPATEYKFKKCPNCDGTSINVYYVQDLRREEEKKLNGEKLKQWRKDSLF